MPLTLTDIKKMAQDHLQEGLLIVIGSGLSIAEGIPGMHSLAEHLKTVVPKRLATTPDNGWDDVVAALDRGDHLESAMGGVQLQGTTVDIIVEETSNLIRDKERVVFEKVLTGGHILPFTILAKHLFKAGKKFHLITPNYDRLVELATEAGGFGVDIRFFGHLYGLSNPKRSADAHRESYYFGRNAAFRDLPCLCIHKPHGSLDWFDVQGKIVKCPIDCGRTPVIITPGVSKYRESFRWAFDDQRTAGNRAVSASRRYMFIGYGFNDDHLEQYVCPNLTLAKPTVIVTKELTESAQKVIANSRNTEVIALSTVSKTDPRTRISTSDGQELIVDEELWNLDGFNQGVL